MATADVSVAACAHCGLPVRGRARGGAGATSDRAGDRGAADSGAADRPDYCCVGCRTAAAVSGGGGETKFLEARLVLAAFLAMGSMEFTLVLYGDAVFRAEADAATGSLRTIGRIALVLFSFPVLVLLGPPILRGAWHDLRARRFRADALVVLATAAAWGLSAWHTWIGEGEVYFETATMLLVLFAFGRRLEAHARTQGRDAARLLLECLPRAAHRLVPGGDEEEVPHGALRAGDRVRVAPSESAPADLVVESGTSDVSAAHVTGESAALPVGPGDRVPAGAVNGCGALVARVERTAADGSFGRILALLDQPLPETRTSRMTDRLASWLAGLSAALAVFGAWRSYSIGGAPEAVRTAVSVLLVACPCALGLATPLAYRAMRAALARRGVLVRDPAALEVAATVGHVLLDKTGTLTDAAAMRVTHEAGDERSFERLECLVAHSGHALAASARGRAHGTTRGPARCVPTRLVATPGAGVVGVLDGVEGRAGSPVWMDRDGLDWDAAVAVRRDELASSGATLVAYAEDGRVRALGAVRQEVRPGAGAAVRRLRELGLSVEIVSGDRERAVDEVAAALGVSARSGLTPDEKVRRVEELRAAGGRVLVAGDGVNDAPALRAADVGVAMAQGTAAARSQAQVEVLGDDLSALPRLIEASRVLRRTIRGNLAWNVAYNAVALALATAGQLHPIAAVAAMIASSLTVSARSYRLLDWSDA